MRNVIVASALGLSAGVLTGTAAGQYLGPTPYLSRADSPFAGPGFSFFRLEHFEDGLLNTTGLSASTGVVLSSGTATDSVDADDGVIDGFGRNGRSFYTGSTDSIKFNFDPLTIGAYPTRAGLVWTDVGGVLSGSFGFGSVTFEAFDSSAVSLGVHGPFALGDGDFTGQTAEDRFFGIIHPAGISAIIIRTSNSNDWECDHVQYGIPGPCRPDLTTGSVAGAPGYGSPNGIVDNDDFFYFIAQFALANLAVCDLTATAIPGTPGYGVPNAVLNNDDFFFYLTLFAAGC